MTATCKNIIFTAKRIRMNIDVRKVENNARLHWVGEEWLSLCNLVTHQEIKWPMIFYQVMDSN